MIILYEKSFLKDLEKITDDTKLIEVKLLIQEIKSADNFKLINNLKKIRGSKYYYRIKLKEYRIGISFKDQIITLIRILHRKDIYKYFPKPS